MKSRILLLLAMVTAWTMIGVAQQPKAVGPKTQLAAAKAGAPAKAAVNTPKAANAVDPDQAYKAHCARCHLAPRKFPEGKTATIMRHMRVRANLTEDETEAILRYLTR